MDEGCIRSRRIVTAVHICAAGRAEVDWVAPMLAYAAYVASSTLVTDSAASRNCSLIANPRCSIVLRNCLRAAGVLSWYISDSVFKAFRSSVDSVLISRICSVRRSVSTPACFAPGLFKQQK
eukprot:GHUV01033998.1.p1 GENE.GHUV01033998.1~~GHUV01033998.1.p1  ORF type:complete len:122 (+),score=6.40 GHUV01033998.1:132-497(+)